MYDSNTPNVVYLVTPQQFQHVQRLTPSIQPQQLQPPRVSSPMVEASSPSPRCPVTCCNPCCWWITATCTSLFSFACWLIVAARTFPIAFACSSWWFWVMGGLLLLCFTGPFVAAFMCLCGGASPTTRSNKSSTTKSSTAPRIVDDTPPSTKAFNWCCGFFLFLSVLVLLVLAGAALYVTTAQDIPTNVPGLLEQITIDYDEHGVPHIFANNVHDAMMAFGLVHAHDRLWQMEFQRRAASGTLSQVLGSTSLEADKQARNLGLYPAAQRVYAELQPETKAALDAYCDGVNAYLATDPHLPLEFIFLNYSPAPWAPADSIVWEKMINFQLSGDLDASLTRWNFLTEQSLSYDRVMQLYPPYNRSWEPTSLHVEDLQMPLGVIQPGSETESPYIKSFLNSYKGNVPPNAGGAKPGVKPYNFMPLRHGPSNNLVISGKLTGSGPLLANDPHLYLSAPMIWYAAHLDIKDVTKVIGVSFPGLPGIIVGRTDKIAWGVTTTACDVQDVYVLEASPDGNGYIYEGERKDYVVREETIYVKDADPFVMNVRMTQDGMTILTDPLEEELMPPLALKWAAIDPSVSDTTVESFMHLMFATDWTTFRDAFKGFVGPVHNFVFASVSGDIGYIMPGLIPQRQPGVTGLWPVPGNTSDYVWREYIPFDMLPQTLNPPKGYIVTANNQITPEGYESPGWNMFGEYMVHYRVQRITDLIQGIIDSGRLITLEDLKAIQLDYQSYQYRDLIPVLQNMPEQALSPLASEWRQKLLAWDGNEDVGKHEPTVFTSWVLELQRMDEQETAEKQWGSWSTAWLHVRSALLGQESDPGCEGDCSLFAAKALNTAVSRISPDEEYGNDVHKATFTHYVMSEAPDPLPCVFDRQIAHGGDFNTVNAGGYEDTVEMDMTEGSSYRELIPLGNMENSEYIVPPGQSGLPLDRHYDDNMEDWSHGLYHRMSMSGYHTAQRIVVRP